MTGFETAILDWIQQNLRTPMLDSVMVWITRLGNGGACWIILGLILLASKRHRKAGVCVLASVLVTTVTANLVLKSLVGAPRPCDINEAIQLLIPRPSGSSFPSGHTAVSFAAVMALWLEKERIWYAALVLAVLIAFSRMYLYVHFPGDVLGGILTGVLCAFLTAWLFKQIRGWYGKKRTSAV